LVDLKHPHQQGTERHVDYVDSRVRNPSGGWGLRGCQTNTGNVKRAPLGDLSVRGAHGNNREGCTRQGTNYAESTYESLCDFCQVSRG
jgi:hypothetical protein